MKKKIGAFGAGQFSLGTLVGGRPGTTIFQNLGGGGGAGGCRIQGPGPAAPPGTRTRARTPCWNPFLRWNPLLEPLLEPVLEPHGLRWNPCWNPPLCAFGDIWKLNIACGPSQPGLALDLGHL